MSTPQSITGLAAVETFIKEELFRGADAGYNENTDLIAAGVIDSLSLMRLISALEEHCQIEVRDEEMVAENFRSLAAIQAFVARHQNLASKSQAV